MAKPDGLTELDRVGLVEIFKEFTFEAAHRLPNVPPGHKCARLHGHSYNVVGAHRRAGPTTAGGCATSPTSPARCDPSSTELDHYYLNEIEGLENPTSEVLARWIWEPPAARAAGAVAHRRARDVHLRMRLSRRAVSASSPSGGAHDDVAVLASGGLDSAILVADLFAPGSAVHPIYLRFGLAWEAAEEAHLRRFLDTLTSPAPEPLVVLDVPDRLRVRHALERLRRRRTRTTIRRRRRLSARDGICCCSRSPASGARSTACTRSPSAR